MEPRASGKAWSRPAQVVLVVALALLLLGTGAHLSAVFLHVAPDNELSRKYQEQLSDYIYPEFEQNWQLFAPNPLARNVTVHARAQLIDSNGHSVTTDWTNLTERDLRAIRHNPLPSHVHQNMLRRAWDLYASSHDQQHKERPHDERAEIIGDYLRRLVARELRGHVSEGRMTRVQIRARFALVAPPPWKPAKKQDHKVWYRTLPWSKVRQGDRA